MMKDEKDSLPVSAKKQAAYLTGEKTDYAAYLERAAICAGDGVFVPYACGLDFSAAVGKELYLNIIAKSRSRLYIMTPYLVPDDSVMNMLINKSREGTDVRIILPQIPDKAFVYKVTLDNARKLQKCGVKIYLMRDSFVHSKLMLSDYCAVVGSINLDMRSFYQQFESALYCDDVTVMEEVEKDFEKTFSRCEVGLKNQTAIDKIILSALRIVAPLM